MVLITPSATYGQTTEEYNLNKDRLQIKINFYADKYHISAEVMNYIIDHESSYDPSEVGDTYLTCRRTGQAIHARGLVQITDCYWPGITNTEALDEDFSINFLAYWISKGRCNWWSTCPIDRYLAMK